MRSLFVSLLTTHSVDDALRVVDTFLPQPAGSARFRRLARLCAPLLRRRPIGSSPRESAPALANGDDYCI